MVMAAQDGGIVAHRSVAGGALGFDLLLESRVNEHFMADLCPPEGVFGGVGHHGGAPVVVNIYIIAKEIQHRVVVGVITMATLTGARRRENDRRIDWKGPDLSQQAQLGIRVEGLDFVVDRKKGRSQDRQADQAAKE